MPFVNCSKALWDGDFHCFFGAGIAIGKIDYPTMLQLLGFLLLSKMLL